MEENKVRVVKRRKVRKRKMTVLPAKDLNLTAFSILQNEEKKCYELVTLKYDLDSKQAKVVNREYLADTYYRMEFEIKKKLAKNELMDVFPKKKKEGDDKSE